MASIHILYHIYSGKDKYYSDSYVLSLHTYGERITDNGGWKHTLYIPAMDEHYHSVNGALQESRHIFIEAGLHALEKDFIRIVEIGFGTG